MKFRTCMAAASAAAGISLALIATTRNVEGQQSSPTNQIASLTEAGQSLEITSVSPDTGLVSFAASRGNGLLLPVPAEAPIDARAYAFIDQYGSAFGLRTRAEVQVRRASPPDQLGLEHVRLQQMHMGVPVRGGELIVHLRGPRAMGANGTVLDGLPSIVTPTLSLEAAAAAARVLIDKHKRADAATARYTAPRLEVFSRRIFAADARPARLAWFVEATGPALREFIWVDASSGTILLNFSQLAEAKSRQIYNANNAFTLPGTLVRSEGQPATGNADIDNAYTFSGLTYDYFLANHARDSYDGFGGALVSSVNYCPSGGPGGSPVCPYANAFWNGTQMVFGVNFAAADDVVAHELTHGVTENEANLFYYYQSGALNESFSDIFGQAVDLQTPADDGGVERWKIGEHLSIGAIRNMMTPGDFSHPDRMGNAANFFCPTSAWFNPDGDLGGVHINSGVPNHAFALMVDGGTFNGQTVTAIGLAKAAKVQYRALTTYLTSGSTFLDNFNAVNQSCTDLVGQFGITANDCTQVNRAMLAVEMNAKWGCAAAATVPPMCPVGTAPSYVFNDGLESGGGNWTVSSNTTTVWGLITNYAKSGIWSLFGDDDGTLSDHRITMAPQITIPANGRMYFDHSFEFEHSNPLPPPAPPGSYFNFDGGVMEYSLNNGATWIDAGALFDAGQVYNDTLDPDNVLEDNRPAFVRSSFGFTATRLNLQSLAGQNAKFRFRIGTDGNTGSLGWIVDNVAIYTCGAAPTSVLTRSPGTLNFGATKNGSGGNLISVTPAQAVTVGYTGTAPVWTASSNQPWAVVTGGSGNGAGQFNVSIANPGNVIGGSTSLTATITISAPTANPVTVAVNLSVQFAATGAAPFGQVDTPAQGAGGLVGAIGVTGWALDDVGVASVGVYRPCLGIDNPASCQVIQGNNLVFVGNGAFLAGARPDVEAAFPTLPYNYRGGWGFQILTNMLPHIPNGVAFGGQGTFPLYAYATDVEGNVRLLGRGGPDQTPTTISVTNDAIAKPFGTIDTPLPGATVSGVVANFGWVLTPDSNTVPDGTDILMPLNGSTTTVYIDGVSTAIVAYNQCRGTVGNPPPGGVFCNDDIGNIFGRLVPAAPLTTRTDNPTRYRNLDAARGAIGAYDINTALLSNGLHTIAWGVSDSAGRGEGIGSRFFTVLNGGSLTEPPAFRQGDRTPDLAPSPRLWRPAEASGEGGKVGGSVSAQLDDLLDAPAQPRGAESSIGGLRRSVRLVSARVGFNPATPMQEIARRRDGVRTIELPSIGRAELGFAGPVSAGYLVANGQLRDLPVGSRLDTRTGVFTWNPPPQYVGTYRLVFLIGGERVDVDVTVK